LKRGAGADATIVEESEEQSDGQAENEARKKNRLPGYAIEFEGIELRKNVGGKLSNDDGFPWTDDEVGEKHDPAGEIADERRKDLRGVGCLTGRVGEATNPLAVDVADGKKKDATEAEAKHDAERAAAGEPVVHEDDPASADHSAKAESEIVGEGEFAGESGHWLGKKISDIGGGREISGISDQEAGAAAVCLGGIGADEIPLASWLDALRMTRDFRDE